jgi:copper(I)-binding protein
LQRGWVRGRASTRRICVGATLVALIGALVACGAGGTSVISVRDAWARPATVVAAGMGSTASPTTGGGAMPGMAGMGGANTSVVYLTIANSGDGADKVTAVSTDVAEAVEMHRTEIKNNVASMRAVQAIEVPPKGEVQLNPGGYHLELVNVRRDLRVGDSFTLTLTFEHAGRVAITVAVRDQQARHLTPSSPFRAF